MTTTNVYFNNFDNKGEQNLVEDLIIESIKIYGHELYYMPRSLVAESNVFGEDLLSHRGLQCLIDEKVGRMSGNSYAKDE